MISEHLPSLGRIVLVLITGWSTLLLTLAALWAANPHAGWLCRLAPVALLLAALIPMGLFGFATMFAIQAVAVVALLAVVRARNEPYQEDSRVRVVSATSELPQRRPQFSLGQLFVSLMLGAAILTLVLSAPDEDDVVDFSDFADWLQLGLLGFALAAAALLAWMLVARGRRRPVAMAVAGLFLAAFVGRKSGLATSLATRFEITDLWLLASVWIVSLSLVLSCCLWFLAKAGWNWWPGRTAATRPPSKLARVTIVLIAVAFTLPTLDLGWAMVPPTRPTELQSPQPNGYEQLVHIEGQMSWGPVFDIDPEDATPSQSEQFVRDNQDRLLALDAALDLPSQATVYWEDTWQDQGRIFRNLYHAWDVAARAAVAQGDSGRAAECHL